jgi:hypothetical protein
VQAPAADVREHSPRLLRKDQERALTAYRWADVAKAADKIEEYETAVQGFAAALLRSGLAVAASVLERSANRGGFALLLEHLSGWKLPGIDSAPAKEWPGRVRAITDVSQYMLATRELVALLGWLRRACRAVQAESR